MLLHFYHILVEVFFIKGKFGLKCLPLLLCRWQLIPYLLVLPLLYGYFTLKVLNEGHIFGTQSLNLNFIEIRYILALKGETLVLILQKLELLIVLCD